jgi:hypothetical protein
MKKMIIVLWIVPISTFSQPLTFFTRHTDRFTDEHSISLKTPVMIKIGTQIATIDLLRSSKGAPALAISVVGGGMLCTTQHHMVRFLFIDDVTSTGLNENKNCKGVAMIFFGGVGPAMNERLAENLRSRKLKAIRLEGDDRDAEFDIPDAAAQKIMAASKEFWTINLNDAGTPIDSNAHAPARPVTLKPVKVE